MTTQHTPGPWTLDIGDTSHRYVHVEGADENTVHYLYSVGDKKSYEREIANARLIAAALELLHALELARDHLEVSNHEGEEDETLALINAVIAKAKGE